MLLVILSLVTCRLSPSVSTPTVGVQPRLSLSYADTLPNPHSHTNRLPNFHPRTNRYTGRDTDRNPDSHLDIPTNQDRHPHTPANQIGRAR